MNKKLLAVMTAVFVIGLGAGLWRARPSSASSPSSSPIPTGVGEPLIIYDEEWEAVEAYYSTKDGYRTIDPSSTAQTPDASGHVETPAGQDPYVETYPDFFVTKWKINGHLHYP